MVRRKALFPVTLAFALALTILAFMALLTYNNALDLIAASLSEDHDHDFIHGLDQLLLALKETESDEQPLLITSDGQHLLRYRNSLDRVTGRLNDLKPIIASNPLLEPRWHEIEVLTLGRVSEAKQTLDRRRKKGLAPVPPREGEALGSSRFFKEIGVRVTALQTQEHQRLHENIAGKAARTKGLLTTIMVGYLLSFTILSLVFLALRKEIGQRSRAEARLLSQQEQLEETVTQRTRELARVNTSLQRENEERRQADVMLAEAQRIADIGSWEWDVKAGKVLWSDQMYRIFEEERGSSVPTHDVFLHRVHPDDRQRTDAAIGAALAEGTRYSVEYRIVTCQGSTRVVLAQAEVMLAEDGRPRHVVGTVLDITERKMVEDALRESEQRLNQAQEIAHLGSWELDLLTNRLSWSDEVYRIFGLRPQEFGATYQAFLAAVHPEDRAGVDQAYNESVREGRDTYEIEHRVVRQGSGEVRLIHEKCQHFRDSSARIIRSMGMVHDITELKQAEARIQTALHEKEILLKEIHHRVKNNLQVIMSLVDLQADALANPELRGHFQDIRDRVRSMALVHEKLYRSEDLARVEFAEYMHSLLNALWRAHGSATDPIRLTFDLQPVSLSVEKAVPCGLILNELAANAIKHAFPGHRTGEVTAGLHTGPAGQVFLSIRDNGVGLPPGLDIWHSTSLGLRLVQMLTGQLNGTAEVLQDQGTEFRITFRGQA